MVWECLRDFVSVSWSLLCLLRMCPCLCLYLCLYLCRCRWSVVFIYLYLFIDNRDDEEEEVIYYAKNDCSWIIGALNLCHSVPCFQHYSGIKLVLSLAPRLTFSPRQGKDNDTDFTDPPRTNLLRKPLWGSCSITTILNCQVPMWICLGSVLGHSRRAGIARSIDPRDTPLNKRPHVLPGVVWHLLRWRMSCRRTRCQEPQPAHNLDTWRNMKNFDVSRIIATD
jgi:hypothetical protein